MKLEFLLSLNPTSMDPPPIPQLSVSRMHLELEDCPLLEF
jgi:hypothetical protein